MRCQICDSDSLESIIDLGSHPLADTFLKPREAGKEKFYPLRVALCKTCGYAGLETVVPAHDRYVETDYSYTSANSPVSVAHFQELAQAVVLLSGLTAKDLAVDIGSNDGTLLAALRQACGCRILGIEPSPNIAATAEKNAVSTIQNFFNGQAVKEIFDRQGKAKVITATNVFNHVTDLNGFLKNILELLDDGGVFAFEVPYLLTLVKTGAFDTIYLEHVSYFAVRPLRRLFKKFGLNFQHLEENDYMGGSLRAYVSGNYENARLVEEFIKKEEEAKLYEPQTYREFMGRIGRLKNDLLAEIKNIKAQGEKIIGIGAATKGNTLLNYCGIDDKMLEFITDSAPLKIGKITPGSHIPIKSDDEITRDIKYALVLPWNIAEFLQEKLKDKGLRFIIPHLQ